MIPSPREIRLASDRVREARILLASLDEGLTALESVPLSGRAALEPGFHCAVSSALLALDEVTETLLDLLSTLDP